MLDLVVCVRLCICACVHALSFVAHALVPLFEESLMCHFHGADFFCSRS